MSAATAAPSRLYVPPHRRAAVPPPAAAPGSLEKAGDAMDEETRPPSEASFGTEAGDQAPPSRAGGAGPSSRVGLSAPPRESVVELALQGAGGVQRALGLGAEQRRQIDAALAGVESALLRAFIGGPRRPKLHVGGSYGKGTSLSHKLDLDLALCLPDYDYEQRMSYLQAAKESLGHLVGDVCIKHDFMLKFCWRGLAFDLVITGPASAFASAPPVDRKWAFSSPEEDKYIQDWIRWRPIVQQLILLAKLWKGSLPSTAWPSLKGPSSFFMELLCIETVSAHPQVDDLCQVFRLLLRNIVDTRGSWEVASPAGGTLAVVPHDKSQFVDHAMRTSARLAWRLRGYSRLGPEALTGRSTGPINAQLSGAADDKLQTARQELSHTQWHLSCDDCRGSRAQKQHVPRER